VIVVINKGKSTHAVPIIDWSLWDETTFVYFRKGTHLGFGIDLSKWDYLYLINDYGKLDWIK